MIVQYLFDFQIEVQFSSIQQNNEAYQTIKIEIQ